jgi:hypothetical protein
MQLYRVKYLKHLRTRKYSLEQKCEWNLSPVWLFLATVTFYWNCLDRVVLALPFWALATFPVCFFVLGCWTIRAPSIGTKWSNWFWKNIPYIKSSICADWWLFCQWDFSEQIEKLIRLLLYTSDVTLYQRELFKKISCLGTFCTQSVNRRVKCDEVPLSGLRNRDKLSRLACDPTCPPFSWYQLLLWEIYTHQQPDWL